MPLCNTCFRRFPPDFVDFVDGSEKVYKCHFCIEDKDFVIVSDEHGDAVYRRDDVIYDYERFMRRLKDNNGLKKAVQDKMIKDALETDKLKGII